MWTDIFIVGGGPAGLATAIALRARGFDVAVADVAPPPIDKTCGEGLLPDALAALEQLGVRLRPESSFPFRGIRFAGAGVSVEASFPNGAGMGVRRTDLHQALVERAQEAGVLLLWESSVKGLTEDGVELDRERVRCRWTIGADGENSRVRQWAGLEKTRRESVRFGFRRHYKIRSWSDHVEVHWGARCQLYLTPVGPEEVCLALLSRDSHLRLDHVLPEFPELQERLQGVEITSKERGAVSASRKLARVGQGRVALVGDASGSVDAITGEGLRLGFEQGAALADAIALDDMRVYQKAHRGLMRRPAFMGDLMLMLDRSAWLRGRVLRSFASQPHLFETQVAMHAGVSSVPDFVRSLTVAVLGIC